MAAHTTGQRNRPERQEWRGESAALLIERDRTLRIRGCALTPEIRFGQVDEFIGPAADQGFHM
jgi:hypothetical protein